MYLKKEDGLIVDAKTEHNTQIIEKWNIQHKKKTSWDVIMNSTRGIFLFSSIKCNNPNELGHLTKMMAEAQGCKSKC